MIRAATRIRMRRDKGGLSSLNQQGAVKYLMRSSSVVVINFRGEKKSCFQFSDDVVKTKSHLKYPSIFYIRFDLLTAYSSYFNECMT